MGSFRIPYTNTQYFIQHIITSKYSSRDVKLEGFVKEKGLILLILLIILQSIG